MIPIILITGFLGSGKTTFINWILGKSPQTKISIILNEFGDIKLESQFITKHAEDIIELANGCMCCVAKTDIPRVIKYIIEQSPQTEYILIEASGLSDPEPIKDTLNSPEVRKSAYLESTICVIDCLNFEKMRHENPIINTQMSEADLVVISKTNLTDKANSENLAALITSLAPDIKTLIFEDSMSPEIFLSTSYHGVTRKASPSHIHQHENYQTYIYESLDYFDFEKLYDALNSLPDDIIRIKGVVVYKSPDGQVQKIRIQRVGSHVSAEGASETADGKSVILFVGRNLNSQIIGKILDGTKV